MKIEIVMTDGVTIVQDVDNITLDNFVNELGLAKNKQRFIMLKTKNNTDIGINVDRVIMARVAK